MSKTVPFQNFSTAHPKQKIAQTVRQHGPVSRADLARWLNMSPATTGRMVDQLITLDALRESGQTQGNRAGRPSINLEFNPSFGSVITVDLRLTRAYGALTDMQGNILAREVKQLTVDDATQSVTELKILLRNFMIAYPDAPPLKAIVMGAPSLVNINTGTLEWAPSLGWENLPLGRILRDEFAAPVAVENDVNLAALGEFWRGAGRTSQRNMVFVSIGTGIGAGIILNGDLYRGATNAAGEVSYFITDLNVFRHQAGRIGDLESRIGREGLIRFAHLIAQSYPTSQLAELLLKQKGDVHIRDILALATTQDPAALTVFSQVVDILTIVAANVSVVLDPEVVVLGGPGDWPWPALIEAIQERLGSKLLRPINLCPSLLGQDALIMGGTCLALNLPGVLPV